jgi:pre-mRNA-processing factor 40
VAKKSLKPSRANRSWRNFALLLASSSSFPLSATHSSQEVKSKAKFRQERLARDGFRDFLATLHYDGKITSTTQWREVAKVAVDDEKYLKMIGTSGSTPHDLFDDFIEDLGNKYKQDRAQIKKWAKAKGLVVTSTATYDWFNDQLRDEEGFSAIAEDTRS